MILLLRVLLKNVILWWFKVCTFSKLDVTSQIAADVTVTLIDALVDQCLSGVQGRGRDLHVTESLVLFQAVGRAVRLRFIALLEVEVAQAQDIVPSVHTKDLRDMLGLQKMKTGLTEVFPLDKPHLCNSFTFLNTEY